MKPKAYSYIRFSTLEQKAGDSLRRQIEAAEKWARDHGYELDDSLKPDEGLSAFRGYHRIKGALGQFMKAVEEGKIPVGSILIVENLDRLSRQEVMPALGQFTDILNKGIKVVTLSDKMEYTAESVNANFGQLLMSIVIMSRAHEESAVKSGRLQSAWVQKRTQATSGNGKLTANCPAWLELKEDKSAFVPIEGNVEIVRRIFKMKLEGIGTDSIAFKLNQDDKLKWKPREPKDRPRKRPWLGWRNTYVNMILRNPAVIGEYQPYKFVDGKNSERQAVGDPIPDYFPQIVDRDIFYAVQKKIKVNREAHTGGRNGKIRNLFGKIAKCAYCGGPMYYRDKTHYYYLVCDNSVRSLNCKYASWRYPEFEKDFLRLISFEIDVKTLLPNHQQIESEVNVLQREKASISGQIEKIESDMENLSDTIATTKDKRIRQILEGKLTGKLDEKERLEKLAEETDSKIDELRRINGNIQQGIENMRELITYMAQAKKDQKEDELIHIRLRLREAIRNTIEEIRLYPIGFINREQVDAMISHEGTRAIYYKGLQSKQYRFYEVKLKGGRFYRRGYFPDNVS